MQSTAETPEGSVATAGGSRAAPNGVGNTGPHSARVSVLKRGNAKKTWMITLSGSSGSNGSIQAWVELHCDSAVWQLERGEGGYVHYQITLTLKRKQRLSWLKNHFARTGHFEVVNNHDAAFDYAAKVDSRIAGPFFYPEPVRPVRDNLEGKTLRVWQKQVLDICKTDPNGRTINWYWDGLGNKGKTWLAKHLALQQQACVLGNGKKNDIAHAVNSKARIVVFILPRDVEGRIAYGAIEQICDGMIFSGKYQSTCKIFDPPHVFVFANFMPERHQMSLDRWNIVEITDALNVPVDETL